MWSRTESAIEYIFLPFSYLCDRLKFCFRHGIRNELALNADVEIRGRLDWQPANLRLTAFIVPGADIDSDAWWDNVLNNPPDNTTSQRTGDFTKQGQFG